MRALTPSIDELIHEARAYDIWVDWHRGGPKGAWWPPDTISIQHGLTDEESLTTIAHELAHVANDDPCGEDQAMENRAWRQAAEWLISPNRYAEAERTYGAHAQLIAAELGVTRYLVEVWRELHPVPQLLRVI
ncbi:MAG: ImmA/IrrE family metallo-endopeptidase [Corynebacterium sp.]|uniref:ImmA/IrrE family metallo-endopeptidase n=1 Tax=unclassified Corynebacterium TaxID=2624378 RepID=UPI003F8EFE19